LLGEDRRGDERVVTQAFSGCFQQDAQWRNEFLRAITSPPCPDMRDPIFRPRTLVPPPLVYALALGMAWWLEGRWSLASISGMASGVRWAGA
jgi:hypothetical protein